MSTVASVTSSPVVSIGQEPSSAWVAASQSTAARDALVSPTAPKAIAASTWSHGSAKWPVNQGI